MCIFTQEIKGLRPGLHWKTTLLAGEGTPVLFPTPLNTAKQESRKETYYFHLNIHKNHYVNFGPRCERSRRSPDPSQMGRGDTLQFSIAFNAFVVAP